MNILIVKTSSLGDIIHTLPALTDAARHFPEIQFDWVVEESFSEIPRWHPQVRDVIPVAWRRWHKNLYSALQKKELQHFYYHLRHKTYDCIIDPQGLLKSAMISYIAKGTRYGFDYRSAREPLAALLYQRRFDIKKSHHMAERIRQLLAQSLGYSCTEDVFDYGIGSGFTRFERELSPKILFIHGTSRIDKEWPENHWIELAKRCTSEGWIVQLPWGNATEKARAERIAEHSEKVEVLPKTSLTELATVLLQAKTVIAVDTGIGHLAAALNVPTLSLYGPTDPAKIGTLGQFQTHLRKSDQISDLTVEDVWGLMLGHASLA